MYNPLISTSQKQKKRCVWRRQQCAGSPWPIFLARTMVGVGDETTYDWDHRRGCTVTIILRDGTIIYIYIYSQVLSTSSW